MTDTERKVAQLRAWAQVCRGAATIPTNGSHETDRLLIEGAEQLEREADALEAAPPYTPLFADVLMGHMMDGDLSASGLARRVFGTVKDTRGYDVPRNRDRIGHYLRGTSYPKPENLQKIADALGVPLAELASARRLP